MKDFLPKILFLFALLGLSFGYGFISHWKQIFPYQLVKEAYVAMNALLELSGDRDKLPQGIDFFEESATAQVLTEQLSPAAGSEAVFVLGNKYTYRDANGRASLAWLSDRDGGVLHTWKFPADLWSAMENHDVVGNAWEAYPVGAHLFDNGDILVSYQGVGVFPIAMGLAKFDRDSNLVWKRDGYYHHWFDVAADGRIIVPELNLQESPLQIADFEKYLTCEEGVFATDNLAILNPDGDKIGEIDLLKAMIDSDLAGLFNSNKEDHEFIDTCDPMHLNDVRILRPDKAAQFPGLAAGDLLMSFRSLNAVAVLDPVSQLFKWSYNGAMHHQHSPRYGDDNQILVFDNRGGRTNRGTSRIVSIDAASHQAFSAFPRDGAELPARPFHSATAGHVDIHPSDSRMLVAWTHQGLVSEIDIQTGELLWELVNNHPFEDKTARMSVYTAKYAGNLTFPFNGGTNQ